MHDLIAFLRARLDEDHETAWGAEPSPWTVGKWRSEPYEAEILGRHRDVTAVSYYGGTTGHIERFDPTRILAEVQAKRAILDQAEAWWDGSTGDLLQWTVKQLALPYAEHPDYRQAWRP